LNLSITAWCWLSEVRACCHDKQKDGKQPWFPDHTFSARPVCQDSTTCKTRLWVWHLVSTWVADPN
jgi:hypothetical protein